MKQKLIVLLRDKFIERLVKLFAVDIAIFLAVGIWRFRYLPPQFPLFYSRPRSEAQLSSPFGLFLLPLLSIIVFFLNFIIASYITHDNKVPIYLLITIGLVISFLFLITYLKIVFLIT